MGRIRPDWAKLFLKGAAAPVLGRVSARNDTIKYVDGGEEEPVEVKLVTPAVGQTVSIPAAGTILPGSMTVEDWEEGDDYSTNSLSNEITNEGMPVGIQIEVSYYLDDDVSTPSGSGTSIPSLTQDPPNPLDNQLWLRVDLSPPELRFHIGGLVFSMPFVFEYEVGGEPPVTAGARYPSSTLFPPFYPSAGAVEQTVRYPSETLFPPFYPSGGGDDTIEGAAYPDENLYPPFYPDESE